MIYGRSVFLIIHQFSLMLYQLQYYHFGVANEPTKTLQRHECNWCPLAIRISHSETVLMNMIG